MTLIETLKRFLVAFDEFPYVEDDFKFMVGSLIWEYLMPLVLNDTYLMDEQIVQFFFDLMNINRENMTNVVFKTIDIHFSMD